MLKMNMSSENEQTPKMDSSEAKAAQIVMCEAESKADDFILSDSVTEENTEMKESVAAGINAAILEIEKKFDALTSNKYKTKEYDENIKCTQEKILETGEKLQEKSFAYELSGHKAQQQEKSDDQRNECSKNGVHVYSAGAHSNPEATLLRCQYCYELSKDNFEKDIGAYIAEEKQGEGNSEHLNRNVSQVAAEIRSDLSILKSDNSSIGLSDCKVNVQEKGIHKVLSWFGSNPEQLVVEHDPELRRDHMALLRAQNQPKD